jgi:hypothetical protein
MQGGDLSNEIPKRSLVTVDTFISRMPRIKKVLGLIPIADEEVSYDRIMLQRFWYFAAKHGRVLELAGIGYTKKEIDSVMDDLDNLGTNPFNYASVYESPSDLVRLLPYRPEVMSVIDIPSRALRYGSYYFDLGRV